MKHTIFAAASALLLAVSAQAGERTLSNGTDLSEWDGNPKLWSIKDGIITGQTTVESPAKGNTFLIWKGGDVSNFDLTFKYKTQPGDAKGFANSGVQYRSKVIDPANWVVSGYQADLEAGSTYSGILYEERGRGILAKRGEKVVVKDSGIEKAGSVGDSATIQASIKANDWNQYRVVAQDGHLQHFINGLQTVDVLDESSKGAKSGILALQLHAGAPMQIQFKDIVLKTQ